MDSVASRYAIALLSIAREENKIKEYVDETQQIIELLNENKQLLVLLKNYGLSSIEKKETLKICFENKISEYILNLLYVMVDNKRGNCIFDVLNEFVRIALNELNIKSGIIYSTILLSNEQILLIEQKVSKLLKANVTLKNKIDKDLLGGFKIQVEDYIIDDSMKSRLEKLKETIILKKGEND